MFSIKIDVSKLLALTFSHKKTAKWQDICLHIHPSGFLTNLSTYVPFRSSLTARDTMGHLH